MRNRREPHWSFRSDNGSRVVINERIHAELQESGIVSGAEHLPNLRPAPGPYGRGPHVAGPVRIGHFPDSGSVAEVEFARNAKSTRFIVGAS